MNCKELVELVTDYLEGRLPEVDRARLEEHLAECDGCTVYVDQLQATVEILGRLPEESLSPEGRERLLNAFRGWGSSTPTIR